MPLSNLLSKPSVEPSCIGAFIDAVQWALFGAFIDLKSGTIEDTIHTTIVALCVQEESMGQKGGVNRLKSIIATQKMVF
jgi:hypothetical protein